jgi:hypothetical protein
MKDPNTMRLAVVLLEYLSNSKESWTVLSCSVLSCSILLRKQLQYLFTVPYHPLMVLSYNAVRHTSEEYRINKNNYEK